MRLFTSAFIAIAAIAAPALAGPSIQMPQVVDGSRAQAAKPQTHVCHPDSSKATHCLAQAHVRHDQAQREAAAEARRTRTAAK